MLENLIENIGQSVYDFKENFKMYTRGNGKSYCAFTLMTLPLAVAIGYALYDANTHRQNYEQKRPAVVESSSPVSTASTSEIRSTRAMLPYHLEPDVLLGDAPFYKPEKQK